MPDPKKFELKIECPLRGPKDDLIEPTVRAFARTARARAKIIQILREVADECDDIARVQKRLEVGGGVVSVLGNDVSNYILTNCLITRFKLKKTFLNSAL